MEDFALEKEAWLRGFLELPGGIPSHDTLSDVLGRIDRKAFAAAFGAWVRRALPTLSGEHVALDGKTLCGSRDGEVSAVHMMSAFATGARFVLAQEAVADKSNEITAIPALLECLELAGAVVSIDAMGCQKSIARQIVNQGADYVLALKDNHPQLCEDVKLWLDTELEQGRLAIHETVDKGHGRIETRRYALSANLAWLDAQSQWAGLTAVGVVESTRELKDKTSTERRYFLCSFADPERFAQTVRDHWSIENSQHWVLDVQFSEDTNRSRKDHSAANLAVIRRMALNLLRNDPDSKRSLRRRKMRAAFSDDYRSGLIFGANGT